MRKYHFIFAFFTISLFFAQHVTFNKIEKIVENNDDFLYRIHEVPTNAVYLGEIEIVGMGNKQEETFRMVLSKAKEIGANTYKYKPYETIDEAEAKFEANHFLLSLYYIPKSEMIAQSPVLFLFSNNKKQTIRVNEINYDLESKSFLPLEMQPGTDYEVSTRKFLGTTFKFKANNDSKYILCENFNLKASNGLSLKSGDLVSLDRSFGDFLTISYRQLKK